MSRYLYRGVLPDKDIVAVTDKTVTFTYKEGGTQAVKTLTLPTLKFLWLILPHMLPKGLQRMRDYGFLRGKAKALRWNIMLILMRSNNWLPPVTKTIGFIDAPFTNAL